MSDQTLDLRRSLNIIRRHIIIVAVIGVVGGIAGAAYTIYKPPPLSSDALVQLSTVTTGTMATQVVIAGSNTVLIGALATIHPAMTLQSLRTHITVKSLSPSVLSITAAGPTPSQSEHMANAVAASYMSFIRRNSAATGKVAATMLQHAINATGPSLHLRILLTAVLGLLVGLLAGSIAVLAAGRRDRRLRQRDEIADALGVPVLGSLLVQHPSDAARWASLLEGYEPSAANAWRLRSVLRQLGMPDVISGQNANSRASYTLTVLSLAADKRALALGPQLAVFAAACGLPTALVIGPEDDTRCTAALRVACNAHPQVRRAGMLRLAVAERGATLPDAALTIVVAVVDSRSARMAGLIRTNLTLLGVSCGAATAEQLATVAVSAVSDGRQIDGILVADPDPGDHTTGRVPQMVRPIRRIQPTRVAGLAPDDRRRPTETMR
jgi:capsular polysaccharide biosynthesis protein